MRLTDELFEQVLQLVAVAMDTDKAEITSKHREANSVSTVRHVLAYVLHEAFGCSQKDIARKGNRHRTTIHYSLKFINELGPNEWPRTLAAKLVEHARIMHSLTFDSCKGHRVVIQNIKTHDVYEAAIEELTQFGDGVKLRINGDPIGTWDTRRNWVILDRISNQVEQIVNK